MAKITSKANLTLGTNLILHIADKGGTDITLATTGSNTGTLTSVTTDWTASSSASGITNRAIIIGDTVTISHTGTAANEGLSGVVTNVTSTVLTLGSIVDSSGTAANITNESSGADINVIAFKKTYEFLEASGLSFVDGVQGIVLASEMVDLWDVSDLDKYARAFTSIEPRAKSLASLNGWEPHNADTLNAIRDTALEIRDSVTTGARKIYALWRSSDLNETTDQFYFWPSSDSELTAPTNAVMTGYINQLFLIYDSAGADNRGSNGVTWYTRCAEVGKTIVMESHNVSYAEIIPVSAANAVDPKLQAEDATIAAGGIYANITYNSDVDGIYSGLVNSISYDFYGYVEGDNRLNQTIHEKLNYLWRQSTNINNDGTGAVKRGDKQWPISAFSGEVFTLKAYLTNFTASQRNDLRLEDTSGTIRQWPSILSLTINAPVIVQNGTFTIYHKNTFGTSNAVVFQNESGTSQQDITITASVGIIMAYSTYSVDGHTPGTPLDIVIAYNRPGFVEPDIIETSLAGSNVAVTISPTADPSYLA